MSDFNFKAATSILKSKYAETEIQRKARVGRNSPCVGALWSEKGHLCARCSFRIAKGLAAGKPKIAIRRAWINSQNHDKFVLNDDFVLNYCELHIGQMNLRDGIKAVVSCRHGYKPGECRSEICQVEEVMES